MFQNIVDLFYLLSANNSQLKNIEINQILKFTISILKNSDLENSENRDFIIKAMTIFKNISHRWLEELMIFLNQDFDENIDFISRLCCNLLDCNNQFHWNNDGGKIFDIILELIGNLVSCENKNVIESLIEQSIF